MATRDLTSSVSGSLDESTIYPFFAVELLFDQAPLRIWTGLGTLDFNDVLWTGTGSVLSVSQIEETTELAVKGARIVLSGLPSEILSLALGTPYQGRECVIYFGFFTIGNLLKEDAMNLLLEAGGYIRLENTETGLSQIFSGYMDQMNIDSSEETSTIEIQVENRLIDLERQRVRRYTSSYQKSVYPNDKGLDFIDDLQDRKVVWGRSA